MTDDHPVSSELGEELGIAATVIGPPDANFRSKTFRMSVWVVDHWDGEPTNLEPAEHDAIAWMTLDETLTLKLGHPGLAGLLSDALS